MKLKPLKGNLFVEEITMIEKSKAGLFLAEAKGPMKKGLVFLSAIPEIKTGDKVIFPSEKGQDVKINEKKYLHLTEKDIWLVL